MNYEPLIERDLAAIPAAAHAFLATHPEEALWVSVTRFAVLAYAPSQHAKRAVMACLAAHEVRDELRDRWSDMIIECARYASRSRQPWSEPPILDPPDPSSGELDELRAAIDDRDRLRAERWLSARLDDAETALREVAHGDALLMLDAAVALEPLLGAKGRFALFRMPVAELVTDPETTDERASMADLVQRVTAANGSIDSVRDVFVRVAAEDLPRGQHVTGAPLLEPYELGRDYAQTLIAHAYARRLPADLAISFLRAVHHNLQHGESYAEWSFA